MLGVVLCVGATSFKSPEGSPFELLKQYMSGSFSSELQSKNDSDYFDIRLRMEPIWRQLTESFTCMLNRP